MKQRIIAVCLAIVVWSLVGFQAPTAHFRHDGPALLPDSLVTPGDTLSSDTAVVCHRGTKSIRHVTEAQKRTVYVQYGVLARRSTPACCEVDHLISLELGGSNATTNLWPEPYLPTPGAHEKDQVENYLHREACAGRYNLRQAQVDIAHDWYAIYLKMKAAP